eukprot:3517599-Amphidinium_carterae.1
MDELVNAETPQEPFAVLMDMAPVHTSAETMTMLKEDIPWIGIIRIPPHCTNFLQPCNVGLTRPFKSAAKTIFNNTDADRNWVGGFGECCQVRVCLATPESFDGNWVKMMEAARQLHASGQLFENDKGNVIEDENPDEAIALFGEAEPEDDNDSIISTEPADDQDQTHLRDPAMEWLEPPIIETPPIAEPAQVEAPTTSQKNASLPCAPFGLWHSVGH